jgi:hypothetical protein
MLRWVWIAAMLSILCILLYIPSVVPPERILDVLRAEDSENRRLRGTEVADKILMRMLDMQQVTPPLSQPPKESTNEAGPAGTTVDTAVANQVGQMSMRLFGNPYFRSIDSLFALASYRLSSLIEALPLLAIFMALTFVDGMAVRAVRDKELVPHSAELFAASVVGAILLGSVAVVSAFLPVVLHPLFATLCVIAMLVVLSRAVANYHAFR